MRTKIQIIEERIRRNANALKELRESITQTQAYIRKETRKKVYKNKSRN